MASAPDCLSGGCGFEPRRLRLDVYGSSSSPVERLAEDQRGAGSIPAGAIFQVRSSPGRARGCGPRGGGSSPPHLIAPACS